MPVAMALTGVAVLLGAGLLGIALQRLPGASRLVYLICFVACLAILSVACAELLAGTLPAPAMRLPVGLPWIGAHYRMDALSAFFLVVVNLGGAGASLFAIGYGQHEKAPGRVLPFYPAFLGGMNLPIHQLQLPLVTRPDATCDKLSIATRPDMRCSGTIAQPPSQKEECLHAKALERLGRPSHQWRVST